MDRPRDAAGNQISGGGGDQQSDRGHADGQIARAIHRGNIVGIVHHNLGGADRGAGKVLDRAEQSGDRAVVEAILADDECAIAGAAIIVGCKEAAAGKRAAEDFEPIRAGDMERHVDAAGALELVEERLGEGQAEFDRAEMLAGLRHRHDAANAEAGDAALKSDNRLAIDIGRHHGLAEAGEIVAEFGGLMHAQIGDRGRNVELELIDAVVRLQRCEAGAEQLDQRVAIVARHRVLHRWDRSDHCAHRGGALGFLLQPRLQCIEMAAQLALVGAIDNAADHPHRSEQHDYRGHGRGQSERRRDPRGNAQIPQHAIPAHFCSSNAVLRSPGCNGNPSGIALIKLLIAS